MLITRLPIVCSAVVIYLSWAESEFRFSIGSVTFPPEFIPLMLALGGAFAVVWNGYGFITPDQS